MPVRTSRKTIRRRIIASAGVESLESRQLLSASADTVIKPLLDIKPLATGSTVSGYSPQQIRSAYGFDQVSINGVTGDGSGQTIAIIAAYDDPNIASDLHTFDAKFGLTDPAFQKVSQTGGSTSGLRTDAGWSAEISLDVEWAHAMAPKAKILLVEANSDSLGNLMSAVDYARHVPDVSVVSMSWGGSEFWGETSYDNIFTTPAGHQGVTFVAASGDDGSWWGPSWPASSPNVLAVGGTRLNTSSTGAYAGETGWRGSGGGISQLEPTPLYQVGVQNTGGRTTPDVSYNADPNTGFAVYDSVSYYGSSGWSVFGGTSAGAPQWAALVAVANQARVANHLGTLDGSTGTLPMLYSIYHDPTAYAADFNDITMGSSGWLRSHGGYDGVTGVGTPKVSALIKSLAGTPSSSTTTTTTTTTITATTTAAASGTSGSSTQTGRRGRTTNERRTTTATAAPLPTATVQLALAPMIAPLTVTRNHDILTPLGNSASSLTGGIATSSTVFGGSFLTRTSAAVLAGTFSDHPLVRLPQWVAAAGGSAPAAATGAQAGSTPIEQIVPAIPEVSESTTPRLFQFARVDWFNAFADAWGALAEESASAVVRSNVKKIRAWTITAAVAAVDVLLLSYWFSKKRKSKQNAEFAIGRGDLK